MEKIILIFLSLIAFVSCSQSNQERLTLPYHSDFSTSKGWSLGSSAVLDAQEKAVKLSHSGSTWLTSDRLISDFELPIKADKTYTISLKSKTNVWPPPSIEISSAYHGDNGFIANSLGSLITNSQKDVWEESTVYIDIPNNQEIKKLKIKIIDMPKKGIDGDIWIKNVSFKKGFHTTKEKPSKKSFNGSVTKVDKLGNLEIFKNGKFEPFFPIGIYTDHTRADWGIYKKQGFNIAMWTDGATAIKKAKSAGLYSSMQLMQYIMPVDENWIPQEHGKKIAHLKKTLREIKNQGLSNDLLFYYIDNEFYNLKNEYTEIADIVINQDNKMHPLYMLNGTYAIARKYNKRVDFTGTYVAEDRYETDRTNALVTLNDTQNQNQPATIAQINRGVGLNFRPILFGAIAKGARGMAFWKDGGMAGKIYLQPWWDDLPKIAEEIKKMIPLIRSNHKTSWSATCNFDKIISGTRMVDNIAYMIIANPTRKELKAVFKIKDLPYKIKNIQDYFTAKSVGSVEKEGITLTLSPQSSKVIKLVN